MRLQQHANDPLIESQNHIMDDFFHGWRRKVGVLMLAVALVLTGSWMRSLTVNDSYEFGKEPSITLLHSNDGCVSLEHRNGAVTVPEKVYKLPPSRWVLGRYTQRTLGTRSSIVELVESIQNQTASETGWKWKTFGFKYGSWSLRDRSGIVMIDITVFDIPYWSIILPLTVISGYLLLVKPPKANELPQSSPQFSTTR